jgi:hypothetical protein
MPRRGISANLVLLLVGYANLLAFLAILVLSMRDAAAAREAWQASRTFLIESGQLVERPLAIGGDVPADWLFRELASTAFVSLQRPAQVAGMLFGLQGVLFVFVSRRRRRAEVMALRRAGRVLPEEPRNTK